MGLSSSKTKTKTTPVYGKQIERAADDLHGVYNANKGNIQANADTVSSLVPELKQRFDDGQANVNAASAYNADVLGGKYLDAGNPYLQDMVDRTNNSVMNQTQASMGSRGQFGGSDYAGIMSDRLARNETGLRYQDYSNERNRMDGAVSQAGGIAAAEQIPLAALMSAAQQGSMLPLQAAQTYALGTGGLLGSYTNQETKQSPNWGLSLLQGAANAAGSFAGGG